MLSFFAYFTNAWVLWLLPLAAIPIWLNRSQSQTYSWSDLLPRDRWSNLIAWLLKILASLSIAFIVIALAGPHSLEQKVQRIGVGAQIALVLDRSASMDDPFSGGDTGNGKVGETKSAAASRLISGFIESRKNDMFGVITFSNSAMYVLPLTENREAVLAAVKATAGNALFQTNIGSGMTSATELFANLPDSGSRVMILLSDGAGRIDANTQEKIREWLERYKISLYWIVLRQPGGLSIFDANYVPPEDGPLPPQIELNMFFKKLRTPFQAYEADDPKSLASAIADINQKEKKPIRYQETIAGHDFTNWFLALASLMVVMLTVIKFFEIRTWQSAKL
ncbi:MAG: VWA domain-containing protein [Candidatus Methylopumilus sp.]|jgi:mxaC protein|nr:VWA domain-containing protein [Candidatus Methylopumilus sp.]NBW61041.1 VWA domain-containing protein [Methylophilaceae bacterium]